MRLLILGGDGFCGWPTSLQLSAGATRSRSSTTSRAATPTWSLRRRVADPDRAAGGAASRRGARCPAARSASTSWTSPQDYDGLLDLLARVAARRRRALRRAARRAVLDEELAAQALHRRQQHQRDAQPAGRDRGGRVSTPRRPPRDHGRIRVRRRRREDPRGLPARADGRRRRRRGRAGDPLPGQPGQRLPHDEDARTSFSSPSTTRTTRSASPTCTRASSGVRRPRRPGSTSG